LKSVLITGGLGFIGSAVVRHIIKTTEYKVIVLDALTYAAMPEAVAAIQDNTRYTFEQGDICDYSLLSRLLDKLAALIMPN